MSKCKGKYETKEEQTEAADRLKAAWLSAEPVLEVLEELLNEELNKLIIQDEEMDMSKQNYIHNKGQRKRVRWFRNLIARNSDKILGETNE